MARAAGVGHHLDGDDKRGHEQMIQLTGEQRKVMVQLGDTKSLLEAVPIEVFDQLIQLGLVYKRSDGNYDFTETGETVHKDLTGRGTL